MLPHSWGAGYPESPNSQTTNQHTCVSLTTSPPLNFLNVPFMCQLCSVCAEVLCDVVLNNYSYDVESLKYKIDTFFVGGRVGGKGPFT